LSAKVIASEKEEFHRAGADAFVEKPVFLKNLADTLHSVLFTALPENIGIKEDPTEENIIVKMSEKIGISEETAIRIISEFFNESLPTYFKNIRESVHAKDFMEIKNSAHQLRGAAASIMLDDLSEECAQLESFAQSNLIIESVNSAQRIYEKADKAKGLFKI
jgi:HPt (histidine-containing phosphotransfer) domain-containing protein